MEEMNIQQQITNEFANAFTSLSARVEVFQTTQEGFVNSLVPKIREVLPELSDENLKIASAIYGICITDEALKDYEPRQFADDVKYLLTIMPEDKDVPPILKESETMTLAERTKEAMSRETAFITTLAAYYQSNSIIVTALSELNNDIILHNINQRQEIAITSILIREHLLPLYDHIYKLYKANNSEIDLRFITAQIIYAIKTILDENKEGRSQYDIFKEICQSYPLGHGEDLYWDLAESKIYRPYYPKLRELLREQIEEGLKDKMEALEAIRAQMNSTQPEQGSDESLRSKVDSMIFETIQFGRKFDGERKEKFRRLVESLLKRKTLQEYGVQDIQDKTVYTDYFMEDFFPIFLEYPQFLLPFIDIRHYRNFSDDPIAHFEKEKDYMMNQFWFRMRKNGYKTRTTSTPYEIATAFAELIYEIINDPKVLSFEV